MSIKRIGLPFIIFIHFLFSYLAKNLLILWQKIVTIVRWILYQLNKLNRFFVLQLMWRRGKLGRPLGHLGIIIVTLMILFASSFTRSSNVFSDTNLAAILKESEVEEGLSEDFLINFAQVNTNIPAGQSAEDITEYEVKVGDTLSLIAEENHITIDTLLAVNGFGFNYLLKPFQKLKILPVSGLEHTVVVGDTVESIATKYKLDTPQPIIEINWLEKPYDLEVGQKLIVPGGIVPEVPKPVVTYAANSYVSSQPSVAPVAGTGQFLWPTPGYMSRGYGWFYGYFHGAIDIANNSCGNPIYAADSGYVEASGWKAGGWGNAVWLDHQNGYKSKYAHMTSVAVSGGTYVNRGQLIGYSGQTGIAYGCHLHFVVELNGVAINPQAVL